MRETNSRNSPHGFQWTQLDNVASRQEALDSGLRTQDKVSKKRLEETALSFSGEPDAGGLSPLAFRTDWFGDEALAGFNDDIQRENTVATFYHSTTTVIVMGATLVTLFFGRDLEKIPRNREELHQLLIGLSVSALGTIATTWRSSKFYRFLMDSDQSYDAILSRARKSSENADSEYHIFGEGEFKSKALRDQWVAIKMGEPERVTKPLRPMIRIWKRAGVQYDVIVRTRVYAGNIQHQLVVWFWF